MAVSVTERKIKNKTKMGEQTAVIENIRYPQFESENVKILCKRMNGFYSSVAEKYSDYAKTRLFRRVKMNLRRYKLPFVLSMNYTVALCNEKLISVVLDLSFASGKEVKTKRFSQMWGVEKKDLLSLSEVLLCDKTSKTKICSEIMEIANNNSQNPSFGYFGDALSKLQKNIDIRNCFAAPSGMCFFIDAGILSPIKYGTGNFVVPYDRLKDVLKYDFLAQKDENFP